MALFGSKKNTEKKEVAVVKPVKVAKVPAVIGAKKASTNPHLSEVLRGPRITEKAGILAEKNNIYTFEVSLDGTKKDISDAIFKRYNVTPVKVRVVAIPAKKVFVRGKSGVKKGGRKAYVFLKEGDKIEFI